MDWKSISDVVGKVSPALGTLIGGPAGAVVGTAIAAALGTKDDPNDVAAALFDPESAVKLRQIEADTVIKAQELTVQLAVAELQARVDDMKSARDREASVRDNTNRILAYTIVGAFVGMVGTALLGYAKVDNVMAGTLVGYLSAKCEQVLAYYFGSTAGSARKTELLAASTPSKQ